MLVSDNEERIAKVRFWATQAREKARHYQHREVGYNYRMSNITAGIGRGQLRVLGQRIAGRDTYLNFTKGTQRARRHPVHAGQRLNEPNFWLSCITISGEIRPSDIIEALEKSNIESRPILKPMHMQPVFEQYDFIGEGVSETIYENGLCLPSDTKMTDEDLQIVCSVVKELWAKKRPTVISKVG